MSDPFVTEVHCPAYRVSATGRRYFTKRAAYYAAARAAIRRRCECDDAEPETGYPGNICEYHSDYNRYGRLIERLAFKYRRADERSKS